MSEWKEYRLVDVCVPKNGIQTGPFGSQLHKKDYVDVGTPIITVEHLYNNWITTQNLPMVSNYDKERLTKYSLKNGDIVFSRVGSVDRRALIRKEQEGWLFSGRCLRIRLDETKANPAFVSFQFGLDTFKDYMRSIAVGATMPSLNTELLSDVKINLPPLPEQKAIARILSSLDDKIELNRQMNETLEAMARAIFKDWFVDFAPTRAKQDGCAAYLPEHIWSLFPAAIDPETGLPQGWDKSKVSNIGQVICGKTPSTKVTEYYGIDVPFITIPDMRGRVYCIDTAKSLSHLGEKSQSKKTLPAGSICVSCIATPGLVTITTLPSQTNQQINSIIPKNPQETYYWYWILQDLGEEIRQAGSGGSVLHNLNTERFKNLDVLKPSYTAISSYCENVYSMFEMILKNSLESRTLAEMRDRLLPKLMSGEIRVKEAEEMVEEVM